MATSTNSSGHVIHTNARQEAEYCLANPDVLHTPAQHRTIIEGLLAPIRTLEAPQPVVGQAQCNEVLKAEGKPYGRSCHVCRMGPCPNMPLLEVTGVPKMSTPAEPQFTPAQLALANWKNKVALLEPWEQQEIDNIHKTITALLHIYQSSAALAITRAALEIGQMHLDNTTTGVPQ